MTLKDDQKAQYLNFILLILSLDNNSLFKNVFQLGNSIHKYLISAFVDFVYKNPPFM